MSCPLFVDYTRECTKEIEKLPLDTFDYCTTDRYVDCPFYLLINKKITSCGNIKSCPVYSWFRVGGFQEFIKITNQYCLSDNFIYCKRYILKKSGLKVPDDLFPDGSRIK